MRRRESRTRDTVCNQAGTCGGGEVQLDGPLCATPTLQASALCKDREEGAGCDDGNPCTVDSCRSGSCVSSARPDGFTAEILAFCMPPVALKFAPFGLSHWESVVFAYDVGRCSGGGARSHDSVTPSLRVTQVKLHGSFKECTHSR